MCCALSSDSRVERTSRQSDRQTMKQTELLTRDWFVFVMLYVQMRHRIAQFDGEIVSMTRIFRRSRTQIGIRRFENSRVL